jgi:hypothetical protein
MSIAIEAYTEEGLLTGSVVADGRLVDLLASFSSIVVENAVLTPFQGPPQRADGWSSVDVDDLIAVVATPETVTPFHAVWHDLAVDLGPYRVFGELPAMPGFDPGRALARPSGAFILIGRVTVELRSEGVAAGLNEHPFVWINRYAVDHVESHLELGFFFPGALDAAVRHAIA